jgi:hypothetical protein
MAIRSCDAMGKRVSNQDLTKVQDGARPTVAMRNSLKPPDQALAATAPR